MESLYVLIPVTLVLLGIALAAWLWSVGSGQFDDLDKAANSILFEDETPAKLPETPAEGTRDQDAS
jgi:cbb3-type cytochrome oxidase maturation protein